MIWLDIILAALWTILAGFSFSFWRREGYSTGSGWFAALIADGVIVWHHVFEALGA